MTFRLEDATIDDGEAIATILSAWIDETEWMPRIHTYEEDQGFGRLLVSEMRVTVARSVDGDVIGFLAERQGTIHALYVVGTDRAKGVGTALIQRLQAAADHLELWTFQANTPARNFYARRGFREVELTDGSGNDEKLPDVRMTWNKENRT